MREGHTGQTGIILRSIAYNQAWGAVVAAARRACNRAWWSQIRDGALQRDGFTPLRLTLVCENGRHRSVGAAYLLAAALWEVEGAAAAEVRLYECTPCSCPGPCKLHGWRWLERRTADRAFGRAVLYTCKLMLADLTLMPRNELRNGIV